MNLMQKIYIGLFAILYLAVAAVSTIHAVQFFELANNAWMSIILAISFELGQAAVLFSLLTSTKERGKVMPWVLMCIFTLVQVLGNVYSSYKHIILNSPENLRFFKEPIFIWTQLPDDQATVIVTYIVGAILPICALLLTSMVTNQFEHPNDSIIHLEDEKESIHLEDEKESIHLEDEKESIHLEDEKESSTEEIKQVNNEMHHEEHIEQQNDQYIIEQQNKEEITEEIEQNDQSELTKDNFEDNSEDVDKIFSGEVINELHNNTESTNRNKSHFINLK